VGRGSLSHVIAKIGSYQATFSPSTPVYIHSTNDLSIVQQVKVGSAAVQNIVVKSTLILEHVLGRASKHLVHAAAVARRR